MPRLLITLLALLAVAFGARPASAISGGHPATESQFAFVRFLEIRRADGRGSACTGSVIAPHLILTAAHCVVAQDGTYVRAVTVKLKQSATTGIRALGFYVHARYERADPRAPVLLKNDLAVLEVAEELPGPYGLTPYDYIFAKHRDIFLDALKPEFLTTTRTIDARALLDKILSRDDQGRPYAATVGFGIYGCEKGTGKCSEVGSTKARYIEKFLFNYPTDRVLLGAGCDPTPFSLAERPGNLICTGVSDHDTRSPTTYGPDRAYTAQPGDSGGPTVVFGKDGQAFIIGTVSFGSLASKGINMNLVEHLDFFRDLELGRGDSFKTVVFN